MYKPVRNCDDLHKPDEIFSTTIRESVIENYRNTIQQRARGINVPFIFIGQRLHEEDLPAYLLEGKDGHHWDRVILKSIDAAGNALYPEAFPLDMLKIRQENDVYVFASQHQQDPLPAGGGIFKAEWFVLLDEEPEMLCTFITADTAETDKTYNDATAFGLWGIYEIVTMGRKTGQMGLHCIDAWEIRVQPKDLESSFLDFYQDCMRYPKPPQITAIERKSTGVTLVNILESNIRGISIRGIERTKASGSKTQRFLECQPYIASKLVSLPRNGKHTEMCITHMSKITSNDSHRHDDLADIFSDAIKLALIDKSLYMVDNKAQDEKLVRFRDSLNRKLRAGAALNG